VFEANGLFMATSAASGASGFLGSDMLVTTPDVADFLRAWSARTEPAMTLARARRDPRSDRRGLSVRRRRER